MQVCNICKKPAVVNYQKVWHRYSYDPVEDEYGESEALYEWGDEPNFFYCKKHDEQFRNGEI